MDVSDKLGNFDQSFIVKMIKDFFLLLLLVGVIELAGRFGLTLYNFYDGQREDTRIAAERLASDVRKMMVNSGGPVASRTLYPILKENYQARGLVIAIEPSNVTIDSIKEIYDFIPKGIPAAWPDGENHSFSVNIEADQFCLSCHTEANIGDILGHVTVRKYLSGNIAVWWQEVRLTGVLTVFKIVLDTTLLFFLLKVRLAPVLSLRSVVSRLAKGGSDLTTRAPIKSADEFGELASDLNRFLDRLVHILEDLRSVLGRVTALNSRLENIHHQMTISYVQIGGRLTEATRDLFIQKDREPALSSEWFQAIKNARDLAMNALKGAPNAKELDQSLKGFFDQLEAAVNKANQLFDKRDVADNALIALSGDVRSFSHFMGEMAVLEEKMQAIAETGQGLVNRLIDSDTQD